MKTIRLKDEIVSKRLAIALKKAGFDNVECFGIYHFTNSSETKLYINTYQNKQGVIHHLAPTYSSVCRWFELKYGLSFAIAYPMTKEQQYSVLVTFIKDDKQYWSLSTYEPTLKRAYELAFLKILKTINKK